MNEKTSFAGLNKVGTYLDEDLPLINQNTDILDAQLAQAEKERRAEAAARQAADDALGGRLDREAAARATEDGLLADKILAETRDREAAITAETLARETAIAAETLARETAIAGRAQALEAHAATTLGQGAHGFIMGKEGQILAMQSGKPAWKDHYELCEFYAWRHPTLKPGFQPAQGGLLENAATLYPEAWAYLQSAEGRLLCKTEEEWQALTRAIWHTNADGTQVGWNGIGGAPFFAPNIATGALRLPDLRGMYVEAAGFDALGVGGAHGDGVRNITGNAPPIHGGYGTYGGSYLSGPFAATNTFPGHLLFGQSNLAERVAFDVSKVAPVAAKNQPRAWGALACVYLGLPAS